MHCPRCGQPVSTSDTHCPQCGQLLRSVQWPGYGRSGASIPLQPQAPANYGPPAYPPYGQQPAPGGPGAPSGPAYAPPPYGPPSSYGSPQGSGPHAPYAPQPYGYPPQEGWGAPLVAGPPAWGAAPMPGRSTHSSRGRGWLVGLAVALVLIALTAIGGAAIYLSQHPIAGRSGPSSNVLYSGTLASDDFTMTVDAPHCQYANAGYQVANGYICYVRNLTTANCTITVQSREVSGDASGVAGVVFRRTSSGNYYSFGVSSDGYWEFSKVVNGTATKLVNWTQNASIHTGLGSANTLQVKLAGAHFAFLVNGTPVGQADDSTFNSGRVGLEGGANATVVFNNLLVEK
jgi:zinc-ribbon domain